MKTIKIPAPKANFGDRVWIHNYRRKSGVFWEIGVIESLEYKYSFGGEFKWVYGVRLDRLSTKYGGYSGERFGGNIIRLYVDNDKISIEEPK